MGENSKIEWCHHTWNPWVGCQKVSTDCDNCYAEMLMDKRYHRVEWGPHGERKRTSDANWKLPLRWGRKARDLDFRPRVFCASLADVFDNQVPPEWRADLIDLIEATPELDWLLLTKRPENVEKMLAQFGVPENVWLGITAEDQANYDRRWPILAKIRCTLKFISYEPALGPLTDIHATAGQSPDWLICGGESGPGHRDMPVEWADDIGWICRSNNVPFFMKQMAGRAPIPDGLMVRQFPK